MKTVLTAVLFVLTLALSVSHARAQISSSTWSQGAVRTGTSTTTCDASAEGAIRYNTTSDIIEFCNGSSWASMSGGVSISDYTTNLIGWWKFDETSGTTAADSSGNSRNGTLVNGPTWQTTGGMIGGALACDGTNDHVTIADAAAWDTTNITVSIWVRKNTYDFGSYAAVISRERSTGSDNLFTIFYENNAVDDMRPGIYGSSAVFLGAGDSTLLERNTWVHYALTYDGTTLRLYRNGQILKSNAGGGALTAQSTRITICAEDNATNTASNFANIWVDDARIYNAALTEIQIYQIYRAAGGYP